MTLNIRSLIRHIITKAVDRLVGEARADDSFVSAVSRGAGEHVEVDYEDLARAMDASEVARHFEASDLVEHMNIDADDVARELDMSDLASNIDMSDLASNIDMSDLAEHVDTDDIEVTCDPAEVAEAMGDISDKVVQHLDYGELAKKLSPLEALAASQEGVEAQLVGADEVRTLSATLLDAAVDRLLTLANKAVEEDLAHEHVEVVEGNGQAGPGFVQDGVT